MKYSENDILDMQIKYKDDQEVLDLIGIVKNFYYPCLFSIPMKEENV